MNSNPSQASAILAHLQSGRPITPLDALQDYGCFRLGARIWELRKMGYDIDTQDYVLPNGKRIARYWLKTGQQKLAI